MHWQTTRFLIDLSTPKVMGIVNVTPDSFSDGGRYASCDAAVAHCAQLVHDGADILDIGGESTRPGAVALSLQEELDRVMPVLEYPGAGCSGVGRQLQAGADAGGAGGRGGRHQRRLGDALA